MKTEIKEFGIHLGLIAAGFFGACAMIAKKGHINWKVTTVSLFVGMLSANFLTPLVINFFQITNQNLQFSIAFLLGYMGLNGVELVIDRGGSSGSNNQSGQGNNGSHP